jgi:hypothetical protein
MFFHTEPVLLYLSFEFLSYFTKGNEVHSFDHFAIDLLPSDFIGQLGKIPEHLSQDDRPWPEVRKLGIWKMK